MTMKLIEKRTHDYAVALAELDLTLTEIDQEILTAQAKRRDLIVRQAASVKRCKKALSDTLSANYPLFKKPRSRVFDGVRVGFKKGSGALTYDSDDALITRIEVHFPELSEVLITNKKSTSKTALEKLDAKTLKALGVSVVNTGDQIVITAQPSNAEKRAEALING